MLHMLVLCAPLASAQSSVQSLNPDISFIANVAGAWFSEEDNLQSGGHDPTVTGFNLQGLEMAVSKPVDPFFRLDANLVFSLEGVELEQAAATTLGLPGRLQVRAGQILTRMGRVNEQHPHQWDFVDQPLAVGRVLGPEGNRGLGVEASWLAPLPWSVDLALSTTSVAAAHDHAEEGSEEPPMLQETASLRQFFAPGTDHSLMVGLSAALQEGEDEQVAVLGADVTYKYRPITRGGRTFLLVQGEILQRQHDPLQAPLSDLSGYGQVTWKWAQRWSTGARYDWGTPTLDQGSPLATALDDTTWTAWRDRTTGALTFWPSEFSRLRLQGSMDRPLWRQSPIFAGFLAFEFAAGAHGAHKF